MATEVMGRVLQVVLGSFERAYRSKNPRMLTSAAPGLTAGLSKRRHWKSHGADQG
jgi:hypothetical protein